MESIESREEELRSELVGIECLKLLKMFDLGQQPKGTYKEKVDALIESYSALPPNRETFGIIVEDLEKNIQELDSDQRILGQVSQPVFYSSGRMYHPRHNEAKKQKERLKKEKNKYDLIVQLLNNLPQQEVLSKFYEIFEQEKELAENPNLKNWMLDYEFGNRIAEELDCPNNIISTRLSNLSWKGLLERKIKFYAPNRYSSTALGYEVVRLLEAANPLEKE